MNEAEAYPVPIRSAALRQGLRIYFRVSLATYALVLFCASRGPSGFPTELARLGWLALLYFALWLGPTDLIFACTYPDCLTSGIWLLVVSAAFAAVAFLLHAGFGRTLLLSLSAVTWFAAAFSMFLSESI